MANSGRAAVLTEVTWWPSPVHYAVMSLVGATSYRDPDPQAPPECEGMIRVRITQAELSETLNSSPATVRRVFADFREMGIFRQTKAGRAWYVDKRIDQPEAVARRMISEWGRMHPKSGSEPTTEAEEAEWYTSLEAATPTVNGDMAPATHSRDIDILLSAEMRAPQLMRLHDALYDAANWLGVSPQTAASWRRENGYTDEALLESWQRGEWPPEGMEVSDWLEAHREEILAK